MGTEKPFRNRVRASVDARYRTDNIGEPGVDQIKLAETRLDSQLAWAPHERVFLLGSLPLLRRSVGYVNGAETDTFALGDLELRAKAFIFVDRTFAPRHLYALHAGLKVPTAPRQRGNDGRFLPIEVQPGSGSWDPMLGMSYAYFARPWSFYTSAQGSVPARGTVEFRASTSLRTATSVQRQFGPHIAGRLGVDTRLDGRSYEGGRPERDSGGFIAFVSPELLLSPTTNLLFVLSVRVPVIQALAGFHAEGPVFGIGVAYDL